MAAGRMLTNSRLPYPLAKLEEWGSTLVVAPHPDDESLACGGAIALLRGRNIPVSVLVISDGTGSHPNSCQYPAPVLGKLRQTEALESLQVLGVAAEYVTFLGLRDGEVPGLGTEGFPATLDRCQAYLEHLKPQTILLPWPGDRHRDHRTTWELITTTIADWRPAPQLLEYAVWTGGQPIETLDLGDRSIWGLDITPVLSQKRTAIACHRSQTTDLINDDPQGFRLTPEVLARFTQPEEIYLEVRS